MKRGAAGLLPRPLRVGLLVVAAGLMPVAAWTTAADPASSAATNGAAATSPSTTLAGSEPTDAEAAPAPERPARRFHIGVEVAADYRNSSDTKFAYHYPLQPGLAVNGFQETVDPGSHFEVSNVALVMDYAPAPLWQAHLRFDVINLDYRNPTSTDRKYDLAEAWVRFGRETEPAVVPQHPGAYVKLGKFERPERQKDRHLESYGLVGTAFERFEDAGLEAGTDLGSHFLAKVAFTQGNPLFIRDPNALAGDTADLLADYSGSKLNSGITLYYDGHVERLDFAHPEVAGYLGWRAGDAAGSNGVEVMLWGRRRRLAAAEEIPGSPLAGDIAVLRGPGDGPPIVPFEGNGKQETGLNVWIYQQSGLTVYGQVVDQKFAGLGRVGVETEVAWRLDLPLVLAAGGHQMFSYVTPAVRFSKLHNRFPNLRPTPEPSLAWDWEKYDGGLRFGVWSDVELTMEYSYNRIFIIPQLYQTENELLATLRFRL